MTTPSGNGGSASISILPSAQSWLVPGERPKTILDNLLSRPDATRLVRATPIQPLFLFIKSLGLADAHDLVAMCLPEQIQGFLDLDVWEKDQLVPSRVAAWLAQLIELPPSRLATHIRKIDPELLTTFLAPQVCIYDLSAEEMPDDAQGMFYETPDRFFVVDILPSTDGDNERAVLIHRFLEHLYKGDLDLARVVINAARWDAGAETEEQAYQFRNGRMTDLGFVDYYDALQVYQEVDPRAPVPAKDAVAEHKHPAAIDLGEVRGTGPGGFLGAESGLWGTLVPELAEPSSLLFRVTAGLGDSERSALLQELLFLANQAMSADRVAIDDLAATEATLQRAAGYLLLGLQHRVTVSTTPESPAEELARASETLRTVPLNHLFRLGYSLTVAIRKLARLLVESGATTLVPSQSPVSLLGAEEAAMVQALLALRPLYPRVLDDAMLTIGLGLRHDTLRATLDQTSPDASQATWEDALGTIIGNHLLSRPAALVPLSRRDLLPLRRLLSGPPTKQLPELLRARCWKMLDDRVQDRVLNDAEARNLLGAPQRAFIERVLGLLATSLWSLPETLEEDQADVVPRLPGLVLT